MSGHRASLERYLRQIIFPTTSVAGKIIEERLPNRHVRDRVRPSLVLWACDAADGNLADALPVAAAFELFDRFLMLHDELTDECAPTVARWGLGQSLNAGDAYYALAFRSLASDVENPSARLKAARLVAEAVLDAIVKRNDEIASASALTAAAMEAGAVIAGAPAPAIRAFATAGERLVRNPTTAAAPLHEYAPADHLQAFEEVVRYVGRPAE
ncbi:MAG: polyprenyl synthetase family protein [Candidatus Eremiobacteraeota bacterium]|nr:polyprenyl synthetase family protein [Candidatus Eremiobacteraeota bacterium]